MPLDVLLHPAAALALEAVFFLIAMAQTLHVSRLICWRVTPRVAVVYECGLIGHAFLGFCAARSVMQGFPPGLEQPMRALAWVTYFGALAIGIYLFVRIPRHRLRFIVEAICACCMLPFALDALGVWWGWAVTIDAAVFASHATCALINDRLLRTATPARDTMAQAVHTLPVGVLCTGADGRVLFTNDTMRSCLAALGLPCDLADLSGIERNLKERVQRGEGGDAVLTEGLRLQVEPDKTCLFQFGTIQLHGQPCRWIVALDVTEQARASDQLEQAADALEQAGIELRASLADVHEVARNEAFTVMRSKVHDVIGQRLSILHRYLEDGADNQAFEQVAQLIEGISEELHAAKGPDAATELAAVVEAFSLVGVEVHTQGELPDDAAVAGLFTQVIRECATNAVRHARAHHVWVAFGSHDDIVQTDQVARDAAGQNPVAPKRCVWYILAVSNDGAPCTKDIVPGGGLTGMRAACEALGATFEVEAGPPFMVRVGAPVVAGNGSDAGSGDGGDMTDDSPCGANDTHEI